MKRQEFDQLWKRIAARYEGRQAALERALAVWTGLGLVVVLSWLGFIFALGLAAFLGGVVVDPAASIWLIGLGVGILVYGLFQAGLFLLIDHAPSEGLLLAPGEAPALEEALRTLCAELRCRPFDEVRISDNFNAGVREIPRLGLFGWPRTVLEIGLPLALALSPDELRAVLAHEFLHLSGRHGRSGSRIQRVHSTWCNVFERMQKPASNSFDGSVRWAVSRFMGWYWPRLHARSLVLSRHHEFQADRVAGEICGAGVQAEALWRIECLNPRLGERFWPDLFQNEERLPEPPSDLFARMRTAFTADPAPQDAARWAERALSRTSGSDETHPTCRDRLLALGVELESFREAGVPPAPAITAADAYLSTCLARIEPALTAEWQRSSAAGWRERLRRTAAEARRQGAATPAQPVVSTSTSSITSAPAVAPDASCPAAALPEPAPVAVETAAAPAAPALPYTDLGVPAVLPTPLPGAELAQIAKLWESARGAAELNGLAASESLLRAVLQADPGHSGACVYLGQHLNTVGNPEGERLLWQVLDQGDELWTPPACEALQAHYRTTGQPERMHEMRLRLDQHESDVKESQRERSTIRPSDNFIAHGLADDQLEPIRKQLAAHADCSGAWLARKDVRHFPRRPLFVLCVSGPGSTWRPGCADRETALVKRLIQRIELPGQVLLIARSGDFAKLARRVMSLAGAEVYRSGAK